MLVLEKSHIPVSTALPPSQQPQAFEELERNIYAALETYSNVHRGSGLNSLVSTHLYEQARDIVREVLGVDDRYVVIFCSLRRAAKLKIQLRAGSYRSISSRDIGLPLGVTAVAVERDALPTGAPIQSGGGTARLVSRRWTIWADAPDRFEAGTPAIVNIIAFAKGLQLAQRYGNALFLESGDETTSTDVLYRDELEGYSGRELLDALRQTLIGRGVCTPTTEGPKPYVNLDNAASTPTFEPVWDTFRRAWRRPQQTRQEIICEVKSICAEFLDAPPADYDVLFTSNTTEAINLVAENIGSHSEPGTSSLVLNTFLEHNSNELPWRTIPGISLLRLPIDDEGFVDLKALEARLQRHNSDDAHDKQRIKLVAVSGASNVLGTCNDLAAISRITHRYGALLLVDAAQLVAHRKIAMAAWGIDYLAFSAHKAYAPFGSGVLIARKGLLKFPPAELEEIQSSGEENVGGIAALGKAFVLLQRIGMAVIEEEERALTQHALRGLPQIPGIEIFGINDPDSTRLSQKSGIIVFSLKHVPHNLVAKELSEHGGIGVRSGCFCAHLLIKRLLHMHPLRERMADLALILAPQYAGMAQTGLIRMSLGIENDERDVDTWISALDKIAHQPRDSMDRSSALMHGGTLLPQTKTQQVMSDFAKVLAESIYGVDLDHP